MNRRMSFAVPLCAVVVLAFCPRSQAQRQGASAGNRPVEQKARGIGVQCIPPGQDCWSTQCGQTRSDFSTNPIPAGFFDPGSLPFEGTIQLQGQTGFVDTVIQRLDPMCFDDAALPGSQVTQIELVQLHLVSCAPITVVGSGGSEQWDVRVDLPGSQPPGTMVVVKENPSGGTFMSDFMVQPVYIFSRVEDPLDDRVFDTALEGIPPIQMITNTPIPWSTDDIADPCSQDGFAAGQTDDGTGQRCCPESCHSSFGQAPHEHCTKPPECPDCLPPEPTGACCSDVDGCLEGITANDCALIGGEYLGDDTSCGGDLDGDGIADICDNCPNDPNTDQLDSDVDGVGDVCDVCDGSSDLDDEDGDGVPDGCDNCPHVFNPDQTDTNGDGIGDDCEEPRECCGDHDGSGGVDLNDFLRFAGCFGLGGPVGACTADDFGCSDLNGDQTVDLNDFLLFASVFGTSPECGPPAPDPCTEDVWSTAVDIPMGTFYDFGQTPIPPDFFFPGSPPFTQVIEWVGDPTTIETRGMTDTVIRRSRGFDFSGPLPACDTVDIEIVELNLVSAGPILVGSEEWIAYATLSSVPAPVGNITACLEQPNGGTFDAIVNVQPAFIFVSTADMQALSTGLMTAEEVRVLILDTGEQALPPITLDMTGVPFVRNLEPPLLDELYFTSPCNGDFIPGILDSAVENNGEGAARGAARAPQVPQCMPHVTPGEAHYICPPPCVVQNHCTYAALPGTWNIWCAAGCPTFPATICGRPCTSVSQCFQWAIRVSRCPTGFGFCVKFYALTGCAPCGPTICPGTDTDGDRLPDSAETNDCIFVGPNQTGTDPNNPDTDGDGLSDGDEVLGTTGGLNLPGFGVLPCRKDLLLECDWFDEAQGGAAHSHRPTAAQVARMVAAFANAPVNNPDGSTGIQLHVDFGQGPAPFNRGNLIAGGDTMVQIDGDFLAYKAANFDANRKGYFRYQIHCHWSQVVGNGSSGIAEILGDDSIVSLQTFLGGNNVSNTMMHEFGHNLNLRHGGNENKNRKPNHSSIMNYNFQFPGVDINCDAVGDGVLDYSAGLNPALNEAALVEANGVCGAGPAIDWNCNSVIDGGAVARNINCRPPVCPGGVSCYDAVLNVLSDHDDWLRVCNTGMAIPAGTDFAPPPKIECQSVPQAFRIVDAAASIDGQ